MTAIMAGDRAIWQGRVATALLPVPSRVMAIEYDEAKRRMTLEQRGLDFARADAIFEGRRYTLPDTREAYGEKRFITYGLLGDRQVVVVWTWRGESRRIISMRKANDREQSRFRARMV